MKTKILLTLLCLFWQTLVWGQVKDIWKGIENGIGEEIISLGNKILFQGNDNSGKGEELWISDGSESGTFLLKDINLGKESSSPRNFRKYTNVITFEANDGSGYKLFRSDGTEKGTYKIWDRGYFSYTSSLPIEVFSDANIYWLTDDSKGRAMLIKKDLNGSEDKIILDNNNAPDLVIGGESALYEDEQYIVSLGGKWLYNTHRYLSSTYNIYVSDGTKEGTQKILSSSKEVTFIKAKTSSGTLAFFAFNDGTNGYEIWKTDGTISGTKKVKNINLSKYSPTPVLVGKSVENGIVFKAQQGSNTELWFSDGTETGTKLIKNFGFDDFYFLNIEDGNKPLRVFTELCQYLIFKFINLNSVTKCNQQFRQN
jgi:ELWxxDGT repeat protein